VGGRFAGFVKTFSMDQLELQVKRIHEKLQQVLRQREALLKENLKLKEELRQLRQSESDRVGQIEQLKQQVEILKVKKGEMPLEEKAVLERRLSQYIREIDRCIALLAE
jgi:hypothetical protein